MGLVAFQVLRTRGEGERTASHASRPPPPIASSIPGSFGTGGPRSGKTVEVRDSKKGLGVGCEDGLFFTEVFDTHGRSGPAGGVTSPKRLRSAFEKGRSHANPFPATNQVLVPWRSPFGGLGQFWHAMRATSSNVITMGCTLPAQIERNAAF